MNEETTTLGETSPASDGPAEASATPNGASTQGTPWDSGLRDEFGAKAEASRRQGPRPRRRPRSPSGSCSGRWHRPATSGSSAYRTRSRDWRRSRRRSESRRRQFAAEGAGEAPRASGKAREQALSDCHRLPGRSVGGGGRRNQTRRRGGTRQADPRPSSQESIHQTEGTPRRRLFQADQRFADRRNRRRYQAGRRRPGSNRASLRLSWTGTRGGRRRPVDHNNNRDPIHRGSKAQAPRRPWARRRRSTRGPNGARQDERDFFFDGDRYPTGPGRHLRLGRGNRSCRRLAGNAA